MLDGVFELSVPRWSNGHSTTLRRCNLV